MANEAMDHSRWMTSVNPNPIPAISKSTAKWIKSWKTVLTKFWFDLIAVELIWNDDGKRMLSLYSAANSNKFRPLGALMYHQDITIDENIQLEWLHHKTF